ncbi:hypothetical protein W02_03690 [Nitrospira sp. KM1]|nr:hypothetical protein W02_03690 [Nitrospira sp. KM1]
MNIDPHKLTPRARNALSRAGLLGQSTRVYELVQSGEICYLSNIGTKTYRELCRYFGVRCDGKYPARRFKPVNAVYLKQCIHYLRGHGYTVIEPSQSHNQ